MAKSKNKISRAAFDEAMESVAKAASNDAIISHFLDICGGARAFAKMMHEQYKSPTASPMVKSRVLEMLLRSLKFAESKRTNEDDFGLLSDEDLEREIDTRIAKFAGAEDANAS